MKNNLHPHHKNNTLSTRIFNRSFFRKLIHAFNFFDLDYHFLSGYSFPPKSVCLILTDKCNLKCRMCDIGRLNSQQTAFSDSPVVKSIRSGDEDMINNDWLTVVAELSRFRPKPLILLTGTEPFLYPDIIPLTSAIAAAGWATARAARLAVPLARRGERDAARQEALLRRAGLPVDDPSPEAGARLAAMAQDKKAAGGKVRFVLTEKIGSATLYDDIPEELLRVVLQRNGHESEAAFTCKGVEV